MRSIIWAPIFTAAQNSVITLSSPFSSRKSPQETIDASQYWRYPAVLFSHHHGAGGRPRGIPRRRSADARPAPAPEGLQLAARRPRGPGQYRQPAGARRRLAVPLEGSSFANPGADRPGRGLHPPRGLRPRALLRSVGGGGGLLHAGNGWRDPVPPPQQSLRGQDPPYRQGRGIGG